MKTNFQERFNTPVTTLELSNFDEFVDFAWNEIRKFCPNIRYQKIKDDFYLAEKVFGSEGENAKDLTFGARIFLAEVQGKKAEVEFFKECDFEWYIGDPQNLLAVYHVSTKSFQLADDFPHLLNQLLGIE